MSTQSQDVVDDGAWQRGWDGPVGDKPAVEERGGEQVDQELEVCVCGDLAALLALAQHVRTGRRRCAVRSA